MSKFEKGVREHWERLKTVGVEGQRAAFDAARHYAVVVVEQIRAKKVAKAEEYRRNAGLWGLNILVGTRPRPHFSHAQGARAAKLGGWCGCGFELLLASYLSTVWMALPLLPAVAIGVALTLFLALLIMGLIVPAIATYYDDAPRAGSLKLIRFTVILLVIWTPLMVAMSVSRMWGTATSDSVFDFTAAVLTLVTPALSAVCFATHRLLRWSVDLTEEWETLDGQEAELTKLLLFVDESLEVSDSSTPASVTDHATTERNGSDPPAPVSGTGAGVLMATVLTAALFSSACGEPLGAASQEVRAQAFSPVVADPEPPRGLLIFENTISTDRREVSESTKMQMRAIPEMSEQFGIRRWDLIEFGQEAWNASPFYTLSLPPAVAPPCGPPEFRGASKALKPSHDRVEREARLACDDQRRAARNLYLTALKEQLKAGIDALEAKTPLLSQCTNLRDALLRLSSLRTPTIAVLTTDGFESCRHTLKPIPAPTVDVRVVVVLVRSIRTAPANGGDTFFSLKKRLMDAAPWLIEVVPPWDFSPRAFQKPPLPAASGPDPS